MRLPFGRGRAPGSEGEGIPRDALLVGIALFFAIAPTNILTPLLPDIRDDFGISIATAGLVVSAYGFARLLTDLPVSWIVNRIGETRLALAGTVLLVVGSAIGAVSPSVEILILARILTGLASGLITLVALTALSWTASAGNRGAVMSLFQVANNTGIALYPLVGGAIGTLLDWRATFVLAIGAGLVSASLLLPTLRRIEAGAKKEATSGKGRQLEFELTPRRRRVALASIYAGVVANMINRHGFRNTFIPLFSGTVLGLGAVEIASGIALMSVVGIVVVTPGARLGDRIGRKRLVVAGLAILALGDLAFLGVGDYWAFLAAVALIGSGDFFASSQTALLSELAPASQRAQVLAGYRLFVDIGALVGPILLAGLLDATTAPVTILVAAAVPLAASGLAQLGIPGQRGRRAETPA